MLGVFDWGVEDIVEDLFLAVALEWWGACRHLINQRSSAVIIDWEAMPLPLHNFRRHIRRTATKAITLPTLPDHPRLRNPKINQLHIALGIQQYILRLQIPIDNPLTMQIAQRLQHLHRVESNVVFGEPLVLVDDVEELAARAVLQDEAVEEMGLEALEEFEDEGVVDATQDVFLV